jgi:hypothetical protein
MSVPADAVSIATFGPSVIRASRSAAHAIDIVDTPRQSGSRSLKFDSKRDAPKRTTVREGFANV